MGGNGILGCFDYNNRGDSISCRLQNPYLPTAGYLTSTLGSCPANIWPARNWTQAAQGWTHCAAYPYGFYFNFTGRRNQYVVADANQMPYQIAMGLQTGQVYGVPSAQQLNSYFAQRNERFIVNLSATKTVSNLQQAKSIGACKDYEYMKADENKALRDEVIAVEKKAEELLKQFEEAMKDADKLSTSELEAKVKIYSKAAKTLVGKSDDLYKRIQKAEKAYHDKKVKEAEDKAKEAADNAGSEGASGSGGGTEDPAAKTDAPERQEGKPPEVKTSAKKSDVTEKGTRVKVKAKGDTEDQALTGKYYEYDGKIYLVEAESAEPIDKTDKVEKIVTPAS